MYNCTTPVRPLPIWLDMENTYRSYISSSIIGTLRGICTHIRCVCVYVCACVCVCILRASFGSAIRCANMLEHRNGGPCCQGHATLAVYSRTVFWPTENDRRGARLRCVVVRKSQNGTITN